MVSKHNNILIWVSWVVIMPILFYIANYYSPLGHMERGNFIIIALLFLIVANMPIYINDAAFSFMLGVSIVVYLTYGLFAELLFSQIAYGFFYLRLSITKKTLYRLPLNSVMWALCSVGSALTFQLTGGTIQPSGSDGLVQSLIPMLIYSLTHFLINQVVIFFITRYIYKREASFLNREFRWDLFISLLMYPIGIGLYFMLDTKGYLSLLYIGIYYIILMVILNSLSSALNMNKYLRQTMKIGQIMTQRMEEDEVIDEFFEQLTTLSPVSFGMLFLVQNDQLKIKKYIENKENVQKQSSPNFNLNKGSVSEKVYRDKKVVVFSRRTQWLSSDHTKYPEAESMLSIPIIKNQEVIGVLTIASELKHAYKRYQVVMVEILANYLSIALENARFYQETKMKSEIDSLTNLYNFQFLEAYIKRAFIRLKSFEVKTISLLLIDLDHFKRVNDQYGHQAGNEVLIEVAQRIKDVVNKKGIVARFGGEEFSVLLENKDEHETYLIAEEIRTTLQNIPFYVNNHMSNERQKVALTITASIGAAVAPDVATEPTDLIRCSDRAMYSDAKNAGRNKVAIYTG